MDKEKIVNKRFRRSFLGYDIEEVDAFLDEIIRELDRRDQEAGVARLRIRMLLEELACRGPIRPAAAEPENAPAEPEAEEPAPERAPEEFAPAAAQGEPEAEEIAPGPDEPEADE